MDDCATPWGVITRCGHMRGIHRCRINEMQSGNLWSRKTGKCERNTRRCLGDVLRVGDVESCGTLHKNMWAGLCESLPRHLNQRMLAPFQTCFFKKLTSARTLWEADSEHQGKTTIDIMNEWMDGWMHAQLEDMMFSLYCFYCHRSPFIWMLSAKWMRKVIPGCIVSVHQYTLSVREERERELDTIATHHSCQCQHFLALHNIVDFASWLRTHAAMITP